MIHLRSAGSQDAEGIARVHAITWKEAYRGLLDESYLAAMSPDRLKGRWIRHLGRRRRNFDEEVFVAVQHDRIIGFLTMGASQDASLPWDSEIGMIYLLAERRGAGLGRALMAAAADHSVRRGMFSAGLWVLRDNAAGRAFYEALGGNRQARNPSRLAVHKSH